MLSCVEGTSLLGGRIKITGKIELVKSKLHFQVSKVDIEIMSETMWQNIEKKVTFWAISLKLFYQFLQTRYHSEALDLCFRKYYGIVTHNTWSPPTAINTNLFKHTLIF